MERQQPERFETVHWLGGLALAIVALGTVVVPGILHAAPPSETLSEQAKRHYEEGQQHYEDGEYRRAAEKLRQAFALTSRPMLLYNISLAEWRAGSLREAISVGIRASAEKLPQPIQTKIEARLAAFGTVRRVREMTPGPVDLPTEVQEGRAADTTESSGQPRSSQSGPGPLAVAGWTGVGLGAAGLVGALVYDGIVRRAVEQRNRALENGNNRRARDIWTDKIQPKQRAGRVFLFTGAGLTVAGGAMLLLDWTAERPRRSAAENDALRVRIAPQLSPRVQGLVIDGEF